MAMSFNVVLENKCNRFLKKLAKSNAKSFKLIVSFLEKLENQENPCTLPNAKHLQGFNDNRYRWRIGEYRIIGIVENGEMKIIQVIKIAKRDDNTYKGL